MTTPTLETYRAIGPFDNGSLPRGLLAEHRLKSGSWARLTIVSGSIGFCWDDGQCERLKLSAGDVFLIPPERPHHLDPRGAFVLKIEFQREA